jgi:hypothetical protein
MVGFRGANNSGGAANPNGSAQQLWQLAGISNLAVGDLAICVFYSRASTKTLTSISGPSAIAGYPVSNASYGMLWVGSKVLTSGDISAGYVGTATLNSVSNGTTGWITLVLQNGTHNGIRGTATPATGAASDPNPPSYATTAGDALLAIFGTMDQNDGVSAPANFTLDANAAWSATLGTDGSSGVAYDLDGGTGSSVDPAVFVTSTDAAWYTTVIGIRGDVAQTATPTGIASAQSIGAPTAFNWNRSYTMAGIASAQAIGSPTAFNWNRTVIPIGALGPTNIVQQFVMNSRPKGSANISTDVDFTSTDFKIDAADFNGVCTWYFEVSASNADSANRDVHLVDVAAGTEVATCTVDKNYGALYHRLRSTAFVPLSGTRTYRLRVDRANAATPSTIIVQYARIIVEQVGATKTVAQVPLCEHAAPSPEQNYSNDTWAYTWSGTTYQPQGSFWIGVDQVSMAAWSRNDADWAYASGSPFVFAVNARAATAAGNVILYNEDHETQVAGTEQAVSTGANFSHYEVAIASNATNFDDGHSFALCGKAGTSGSLYVASAYLLIKLEHATALKGVVEIPMHSGFEETTGTNVELALAMATLDTSKFSAVDEVRFFWGIDDSNGPGTILVDWGTATGQDSGSSHGTQTSATCTTSSTLFFKSPMYFSQSVDVKGYLTDGHTYSLYQTAIKHWDETRLRVKWHYGSSVGIPSAESIGTPTIRKGWVSPSGIASAEAIGAATASLDTLDRTKTPTGIASAEAIGSPTVLKGNVDRAPTGIASAESMGAPTILKTFTRTVTGIASTEAVGTVTTLKGNVDRAPSGIASAENLGAPTVVKGNVTRQPTGIATSEAVGSATRVPSNAFGVAAIASAEAFGSPTVQKGNVTRQPTGIASAEAFGDVTWTTANVVGNAGGIASAEAVGVPLWHLVRLAAGIASEETVGSATHSSAISRSPAGIASSEAFGTAAQLATVNRAPAGLATAEAVGSATSQARNACIPSGVGSAEAMGAVTVVTGNVTRQPTGIASAEGVGVPSTASGMTRSPAGIASAENIGAVKVNLTMPVVGIASGEQTGVASALAALTRSVAGVPTEEAVGTASAAHSDVTRTPVGIPSQEAFGTANRVSTITRQPGGVDSAEALGSTTLQLGPVTRTVSGITSAEVVGNAVAENVGGQGQTQAASGIPSAEAMGTATTVQGGVTRAPAGIASSEQFGSPTRVANITPAIAGIISGEFMGEPTVVKANIIQPAGIASGQQMGSPARLPGAVSRIPTGIASGEAFGTPAELLRYLIAASGIVSEESIGTPTWAVGGVTRIVLGIASAEAFGIPWAGSDLQMVYPAGIASAFQIGKAWVFIESDIEAVGGEHVQRASRTGRSRVSSERKPPEPRTENHTGRMR